MAGADGFSCAASALWGKSSWQCGENLDDSGGCACGCEYAEFYGEWAGEYLPGYGEDEYDAEDFCEDE